MTSNVVSEDMRQASTSGLTFKDMRIRDKLYIDKTLLIKDILDQDDSEVFLYTRPRRFGKSTNITMLDAFFNLRYEGNTWFDGLAISEFSNYDRYRNRFPVIRINLKDTVPLESEDGYRSFLEGFVETMRETLKDFSYLLQSDKAGAFDKADMMAVLNRTADDRLLSKIMKILCRMRHDHHGTNAIILIDEYDRGHHGHVRNGIPGKDPEVPRGFHVSHPQGQRLSADGLHYRYHAGCQIGDVLGSQQPLCEQRPVHQIGREVRFHRGRGDVRFGGMRTSRQDG